jgi:NYN domain
MIRTQPWRCFRPGKYRSGRSRSSLPSVRLQKGSRTPPTQGHIVVKKAYCDFERYKDFKRGLHETAFELIEIPHLRQSGKNSADIPMVVDALDLYYTDRYPADIPAGHI